MTLLTTEEMDTAMIRLCKLDDLPVGLGRAFAVGERTIAVFRTRQGKLFAVDNRCPHKGGPLSEGMLAGDHVVCPLHAFRFEFSTGTCDQPGICPVATYPVIEDEGVVYLALPAR